MEAVEHCGVFGIFNHPDAAEKTYYGLFALQHRGEESAGIATTDGSGIDYHKDMGLVGDVFEPSHLDDLSNPAAIGHVRYSTTGSSNLLNAQPIVVDSRNGAIAVAHNGNLVNSAQLRKEFEEDGSIFQTTMDSEIIVHQLASPKISQSDTPYRDSCTRLRGAYSMVILREDELVAIRDPQGFRPLCLGRLDDAWVVASETCAFELVGAEYERDVAPGEIVRIQEDGITTESIPDHAENGATPCFFEYVYFSRPDSKIFGRTVQTVREQLGNILARESGVEADCVISIPDSGNAAALGFAQESGLPFRHGFIRNHYVGRSFIQPTQDQREEFVRVKMNAVEEVIRGKKVVVVDDSIIRGTTSRSRVGLLREAGAEEVHLRISCPPTVSPCYYGIDFPNEEELIANQKSIDEIAEHANVDSLAYLSVEGLYEAIGAEEDDFCTACWTRDYPVSVDDDFDKHILE